MIRDLLNAAIVLWEDGPSLSALAEASREPYEAGEELPWWADNLGHFLCGIAIGAVAHLLFGGWVIPTAVFLGCATVWELFEYHYEVRPWDPADEWPLDRAVEDTLLDTLVGTLGCLTIIYLFTL